MKKKKYDPDKTYKAQYTKNEELTWQAKFCKIVEAAGGFAEKIEFKAKGGCPDIMAAIPMGDTFLFEFKMGHMKVDPLQKVIFKRMIAGGFQVICISVYVEGSTTWFILFNFETGKEIKRCQPSEILDMLWGEE